MLLSKALNPDCLYWASSKCECVWVRECDQGVAVNEKLRLTETTLNKLKVESNELRCSLFLQPTLWIFE